MYVISIARMSLCIQTHFQSNRSMYCLTVVCIVIKKLLYTYRFLKNLQIIVSTVLQSIPALGSIVILISLVLCILPLCNYVHLSAPRVHCFHVMKLLQAV